MLLTLNVEKVEILTSVPRTSCENGPDKIIFHLDKKEGSFPYKGNAIVVMSVANGTGHDYFLRNFPGVKDYKVIYV